METREDASRADTVPGNPYQAPDAGPPAGSIRLPLWVHRALSILIGVLCAAQFITVWMLLIRLLIDVGADRASLIRAAQMAAMPFTLALAGVFLAFGRRMSVLLFVAYFLQYAAHYTLTGRADPASVALVLVFLAYAAWRWRSGALNGWPHRGVMRQVSREGEP